MQSYMDTETTVDESKLKEVKGYLELITKVEGPEIKSVVLELRRCAGKCLQWCRKCAASTSLVLIFANAKCETRLEPDPQNAAYENVPHGPLKWDS